MNLNNEITRQQVKGLLSSADDDAGLHMLWVGKDGEVHLDVVPQNLTPVGYADQIKTQLKFRLGTLPEGGGYTGSEAVADEGWVGRIHRALTKNWESGKDEYIDDF